VLFVSQGGGGVRARARRWGLPLLWAPLIIPSPPACGVRGFFRLICCGDLPLCSRGVLLSPSPSPSIQAMCCYLRISEGRWLL
jgi:hypothetical protein